MIIGFTGVKGAGKDTAASFLIETYEFQKVGFADSLKEAVCNLFDVPLSWLEKYKNDPDARVSMLRSYSEPGFLDSIEYASDMNLRTFLQRFGTEMGRNTFGKDFWVNVWENYIFQQNIKDDNIVVPDVRFQNEVERINRLEGIVIRIVRPGYEPDDHESEQPLPDILIDGQINNSGSLDDFRIDVIEYYQDLTRDRK